MGVFIQGKPGDVVGDPDVGYVFVGIYSDPEHKHLYDVLYDPCDPVHQFYVSLSEDTGKWIGGSPHAAAEVIVAETTGAKYILLAKLTKDIARWANRQPATLAARTLAAYADSIVGPMRPLRDAINAKLRPHTNVLDWLEHYSQQN